MESVKEESSPLLKKEQPAEERLHLFKKEQPAEEKLSVVLEKAKQAVNEKENEKISDHLDRLKNNGQNGDVQNAVSAQRTARLNELRQRYANAQSVFTYCFVSDFLYTARHIREFFVPYSIDNNIKIEFIFSKDGDYLLVRMNERSKEKIISMKSYKIKCVFEDEDDKRMYFSTYGTTDFDFNAHIKNVFEAVSLNGEIRYSLEQLLGKS